VTVLFGTGKDLLPAILSSFSLLLVFVQPFGLGCFVFGDLQWISICFKKGKKTKKNWPSSSQIAKTVGTPS